MNLLGFQAARPIVAISPMVARAVINTLRAPPAARAPPGNGRDGERLGTPRPPREYQRATGCAATRQSSTRAKRRRIAPIASLVVQICGLPASRARTAARTGVQFRHYPVTRLPQGLGSAPPRSTVPQNSCPSSPAESWELVRIDVQIGAADPAIAPRTRSRRHPARAPAHRDADVCRVAAYLTSVDVSSVTVQLRAR